MKSLMPVLVLLALLVVVAGAQAADKPVNMNVDGKAVTVTPPAIERAGTTYVPLRSGVQALGGSVKWNPNTKSATVVLCGKVARISGSEGLTIGGSIYLPLRLMSTRLGCGVKWEAASRTVFITKPKTGG